MLRHVQRSLPVFGMVALVTLATAARGEVRYTVIDLGTLYPPGTPSVSFAYDLNDAHQVAGYSQTVGDPNGPARAWRWSGGVLDDLGTLGGPDSLAGGINSQGVVTGWSTTATGGVHGFTYTAGPMQDIGGQRGSRINDAGDVAGEVWPGIVGQGTHAAFYNGGLWQDLGVLAGGTWSTAYDINMHAEIVGTSDTPNGRRAFLCPDPALPVLQDLGTLTGGNWSDAYGINRWGKVVGTSAIDMVGQDWHGFVYDSLGGGPLQDLGALAPAPCPSWAIDINASGVIVGRSYDRTLGPGAEVHGYVYSGGVMEDLNDLIVPGSGWLLEEGRAINDLGWIVGNGIDPSGQPRAFLLEPIPEPATLVLVGLGAAALAARRKRRK